MFKAIGFTISLLALSVLLSDAFVAFESAAVATFGTVETAANLSTAELEKIASSE